MLNCLLRQPDNEPIRVLCLGAHADDIEIGCGGTILQLLKTYSRLHFHWVVFSSGEVRADEARNSANAILQAAESKAIVVRNFRNSFFPYVGLEIKEYFEQISREFSPDLILTHYRQDLHQDHRTISELTWNTFRDHLILEYEIPKYDGDFGTPNFFVHLDETLVREKIRLISEHFRTQQGKQWFDDETFLSVLRIRGIESHSPSRYAEAFYARKILLGGNNK